MIVLKIVKVSPTKGACKNTLNIIYKKYLVYRIMSEQLESLSKIQVHARKVFANDHLRWTVEDWTMIFFSVEADLLPTKYGELRVRLRRKQNQLDVRVLEARSKRNLTIKV